MEVVHADIGEPQQTKVKDAEYIPIDPDSDVEGDVDLDDDQWEDDSGNDDIQGENDAEYDENDDANDEHVDNADTDVKNTQPLSIPAALKARLGAKVSAEQSAAPVLVLPPAEVWNSSEPIKSDAKPAEILPESIVTQPVVLEHSIPPPPASSTPDVENVQKLSPNMPPAGVSVSELDKSKRISIAIPRTESEPDDNLLNEISFLVIDLPSQDGPVMTYLKGGDDDDIMRVVVVETSTRDVDVTGAVKALEEFYRIRWGKQESHPKRGARANTAEIKKIQEFDEPKRHGGRGRGRGAGPQSGIVSQQPTMAPVSDQPQVRRGRGYGRYRGGVEHSRRDLEPSRSDLERAPEMLMQEPLYPKRGQRYAVAQQQSYVQPAPVRQYQPQPDQSEMRAQPPPPPQYRGRPYPRRAYDKPRHRQQYDDGGWN